LGLFLIETKKILADVRASCVLGLAGAVRGVSLAVFNFLAKRQRHLPAYPSQFDAKARDHGACQPLRVALNRGPAEFKDAVGDHFAYVVGIVRAVQQGEHGVKGVAQKFGTDIVENGAYRHGATRAWNDCDPV